MKTAAAHPDQLTFTAFCEVVKTGPDTFRLVPQAPVTWVAVSRAAKLTGVPVKTIYRLAAANIIEVRHPSPRKKEVRPDQVREHLKASEAPGYWKQEGRARKYLAAARKKSGKTKK